MEPGTQKKTYEELLAELNDMRWQLDEATDTIQAIRTGQIDALIVSNGDGPQLYSLKTADRTYRVFLEQMNEGAVTLNEEGVILYCNSAFTRITGLPVSQILGRAFSEFIPADCHAGFARLFERGWKEDVKGELLIKGPERQTTCQLSASALQMEDGESLSMIVTDMSFHKEAQAQLKANNEQLKAANAALEQSNYDLLQFASVASHDLQEPLRKIMIFSGMLAKKLPDEEMEDAAVLVGKIAVSSQRMKLLVADILTYSRLADDEFATGKISLSELFKEILDDFEILIMEKEAIIEIGFLPTIVANYGQMRQVFQNLLNNALKFCRPGVPPRVQITCEYEYGETECAIVVSDNGIGFDTRYSDRIFTLFQRLHPKDQYEGSGIGLAVAKKIVEKHGGSISVHSEEGKGSTFRIVLPLA